MSFLVVGIGLGALKITVTLSSFRSPRDGHFCNHVEGNETGCVTSFLKHNLK